MSSLPLLLLLVWLATSLVLAIGFALGAAVGRRRAIEVGDGHRRDRRRDRRRRAPLPSPSGGWGAVPAGPTRGHMARLGHHAPRTCDLRPGLRPERGRLRAPGPPHRPDGAAQEPGRAVEPPGPVAAGTVPTGRSVGRRLLTALLAVITGKLAIMGLGVTAAVASVGMAGAAGLLPERINRPVRDVVTSVTGLQFDDAFPRRDPEVEGAPAGDRMPVVDASPVPRPDDSQPAPAAGSPAAPPAPAQDRGAGGETGAGSLSGRGPDEDAAGQAPAPKAHGRASDDASVREDAPEAHAPAAPPASDDAGEAAGQSPADRGQAPGTTGSQRGSPDPPAPPPKAPPVGATPRPEPKGAPPPPAPSGQPAEAPGAEPSAGRDEPSTLPPTARPPVAPGPPPTTDPKTRSDRGQRHGNQREGVAEPPPGRDVP